MEGESVQTSERSGVELVGFKAPVDALVVGASRGIGQAFADALCDQRSIARLFVTSREPGRAAATDQLAANFPERVIPLGLRVDDESSVASAASELRRHEARLGLVINCAGVLHDGQQMRPEKRLEEVDPENMQRAFAVNAIGPALLAKHLHASFSRDGRVVFATLSARVGSIEDNRLGGWYAYRVSKAAQNMVTRNLSIELARRVKGMICVALHPGTVDTELSRPFQARVPASSLFAPERAASQLLAVIDGLSERDNGSFIAWDGQPIPF